MSGLSTDLFFRNALASDASLEAYLDGRIYNTARPDIDETEDRVPYIIITLESVANDAETKDDIEGPSDKAAVSLLLVDSSREALASLAENVRSVVDDYWRAVSLDDTHVDRDICPDDWTFQAGRVEYDGEKPCLFQTLVYTCDLILQ